MRLDVVRTMLAGRYLDVVILGLTALTLGELLTDGRPVPALVSAICGMVLLARHRAPAIAIVASVVGQLTLAALMRWHDTAGAFGLDLLTFVVAGGLRPEWTAWLGWACGVAQAAFVETRAARCRPVRCPAAATWSKPSSRSGSSHDPAGHRG